MFLMRAVLSGRTRSAERNFFARRHFVAGGSEAFQRSSRGVARAPADAAQAVRAAGLPRDLAACPASAGGAQGGVPYHAPDGPIEDRAELARIKALAIPPA
jgi:hypothetical protein